jgi:molecular chaperone GrpE
MIKKENKQTEWQQKAEEYLSGWKRAKADFLNYQKEEADRLDKVSKFANEDMVKELLTVLDSFDLALANVKKEEVEGIKLIKSQLEKVLEKNGLQRLTGTVGQEFDPVFHEAIALVDSDQESSIVIEEVEAGYLLADKVIRPARVKVSK